MNRAFLAILVTAVAGSGLLAQQRRANPCDPGNAGLTLPPGFCAMVVADNLGPTRHITVSPRGDVYTVLAAQGGPFGPPAGGAPQDAVVALRDTNGDGTLDQIQKFGPGLQGTGIAWHDNYLYVASNTQVVRFKMNGTSLVPTAQPEIIVADLPRASPHSAKPIAFGEHGELFVHIGSPSNACQNPDRRPGVAGQNPCPTLDLFGGVWKYDANTPGQKHVAANRVSTGERHTPGIAWSPAAHQLYTVQNNRDQLDTLWPKSFTAEDNANRPAEELHLIRPGANFGWPYCFFDLQSKKRLLNPEYGGDGRTEGDCAKYDKPIATFPAHNAPVGLMFYTGRQFPGEYKNGAFVVFHGSWNRTPFEMDGFNIRFVPFKGELPSGPDKVFASGFVGKAPVKAPNEAAFRPVGIAQAPDGSVYVTDDAHGRIWKISYTGNK